MRHQAKNVVSEVIVLAVGKYGPVADGVAVEVPRVAEFTVGRGITVVGDLAKLHEERVEGQERDDPEEEEDRPRPGKMDERQNRQPVRARKQRPTRNRYTQRGSRNPAVTLAFLACPNRYFRSEGGQIESTT